MWSTEPVNLDSVFVCKHCGRISKTAHFSVPVEIYGILERDSGMIQEITDEGSIFENEYHYTCINCGREVERETIGRRSESNVD